MPEPSVSYYVSLPRSEYSAQVIALQRQVDLIRASGLSLNMARGKPSADQLALSLPMLDVLTSNDDLSDGGVDCRNYGCLEGIPSARAFFGELLGVAPEAVFVGGTSSLTLMFDAISHAMIHGVRGGEPFLVQMQRAPLKWICLTPGYDRHFGITEQFGFELVSVPLGPCGPDVAQIAELVKDPQVKGMWCVPKYSNPTGVTYSDDVVRAIASLAPAAPDFRVYWDNAYCVHDLDPECPDRLLNVFEACEAAGNFDLVYEFASTSKVTLPGSGISAIATSPENLADLLSEFKHRMISEDKLNQLRHVRFLRDAAGVRAHMARQAELLRPRFELVERRLTEGLGELGLATWTRPRGGYFVSFEGPKGSARAIVDECRKCGVTLTGAGATYPHGADPNDSNIRIAPTFPSLAELDRALEVFVTCVKLVCTRLARKERGDV